MELEFDPIGADVRRTRKRKGLGPDAACAWCGINDPDALRIVKKSMLEVHHVMGRANDESTTVVVCLNHHAQLTAGQRDAGVFERDSAGPVLGPLAKALRSLASFFALLAPALMWFAEAVESLAAHLDTHHPQWRTFTLDEFDA